jgi:flavin-dependent dehydrogenase
MIYRTYLGADLEVESDHCIVNQKKFFKEMLSGIDRKKCRIIFGCGFSSYEYTEDKKILVKTNKGNFNAKLLIDASGIDSPVMKKNSIKTTDDYYFTYAKIIDTDYIDPSKMVLLDIPFHDKYKLWFWMIPISSKRFVLASYYMTGKDIPLAHAKNNVERYIKMHSIKVLKSETKVGRLYWCDFQKTSFDNILLVGESANQGVPLNAYLFAKIFTFSRIAAEVAEEALKKDDFSGKFLKRYDRAWKKNVALSYSFNRIYASISKYLDDEETDLSFRVMQHLPAATLKRYETGGINRKDILLIHYSMLRYMKFSEIIKIFVKRPLFYLKSYMKLAAAYFLPFYVPD